MELEIAVAGGFGFTVVGANGVVHGLGAAVVQIRAADAEAP